MKLQTTKKKRLFGWSCLYLFALVVCVVGVYISSSFIYPSSSRSSPCPARPMQPPVLIQLSLPTMCGSLSIVVPNPFVYNDYTISTPVPYNPHTIFIREQGPFTRSAQYLSVVLVVNRVDVSDEIDFQLNMSTSIRATYDHTTWQTIQLPTPQYPVVICNLGSTACLNMTVMHIPFLHYPFYEATFEMFNLPSRVNANTFSFTFRSSTSTWTEVFVVILLICITFLSSDIPLSLVRCAYSFTSFV